MLNVLTGPEPFPDILEFLRAFSFNTFNTFQTGSPPARTVSSLGRGVPAQCVPHQTGSSRLWQLCMCTQAELDLGLEPAVQAAAPALITGQMTPVPPDNSLGISYSHLLPQTCMRCQASLL